VLEYARSLMGNDKDLLGRELVRLVGAKEGRIWSVALESLVQGWGSEISSQLASLLSREKHTDQWEAQILFALVRLRFHPIAKRAIAHISRRIAAGDRTVIPLLAALCHVDTEACLDMEVPFIVGLINIGHIQQLSGYIPAIVNHFLDADSNLVALLVCRIAARNHAVAIEFAGLISEYLDRQYVIARRGDDQVRMLKQQVADACAGP
jgi:hypothetical protein